MSEEIDIERAKNDFEYFCKEVLGLERTVSPEVLKNNEINLTGVRGRKHPWLSDAIEDLDADDTAREIIRENVKEEN